MIVKEIKEHEKWSVKRFEGANQRIVVKPDYDNNELQCMLDEDHYPPFVLLNHQRRSYDTRYSRNWEKYFDKVDYSTLSYWGELEEFHPDYYEEYQCDQEGVLDCLLDKYTEQYPAMPARSVVIHPDKSTYCKIYSAANEKWCKEMGFSYRNKKKLESVLYSLNERLTHILVYGHVYYCMLQARKGKGYRWEDRDYVAGGFVGESFEDNGIFEFAESELEREKIAA